MILATYISDLLYRYDCVIVPDFGGFVTNQIGATLNKSTHTFYPPTKKITFNNHLKHNDGLLANYIASAENISFDKASLAISLSVIKWKNKLQNDALEIDNLGVLSLNSEKQIIFEPLATINYLTNSFGLSTIASSAIARYKQQVKPLLVEEKISKKGIPSFIKYAATAAVILTVSVAAYNGFEQNRQNKILAQQEQKIQKKIQTATFVISNPLPTIEINVVKEIAKPYHIVAGAFQFTANAEKKVAELKAKGFDATILGVNKWGLTEVTFNSYSERKDAINNLYKIQKTESKDAWLLVKN